MGLLIVVIFMCILFALLPLMIFSIICSWTIYKKAGKSGWECIVPVYNMIVLLEIASLPPWYIFLMMIPFVNIYISIKIAINLTRNFGKSTNYAILYFFFPVIVNAILAFGKSEYKPI